MISSTIPYKSLGITKPESDLIVSHLNEALSLCPLEPVNIRKISNSTRILASEVKKIFYFLLYIGDLKATYVPVHKPCKKPLGKMKTSIEEIYNLLLDEQYLCHQCLESEIGNDDIDVQIVFWGKDAEI